MRQHTKYQGSMPCGSRQENFFMFLYISLCKTCDSQGGVNFGPRGIGRGPLDGATYQISRLYAFGFRTRRVLKFFSPLVATRIWHGIEIF